MANIDDQIFVCIDCETTGLDTNNDRIIEVAVVLFSSDKILEQYETLIDPECEISAESMAIHHITQEMVQGKPKIHEVLKEILKMVGKHIIIGHGVKFDIDMLANAAKRVCIPCGIQENRVIDTLRLARLYGDSSSNALEKLGVHFNVASDGAHRAMSDVMVNIEVFKHLSKRYKTTENLFNILSRPIQLKAMPLGKHKGRPFRDIPQQYLQWAANKDFDEDLMFSIRAELKRRKQGNLFEQAGSPFADL
jgi:DNA polymerase-3 subunit epsilon